MNSIYISRFPVERLYYEKVYGLLKMKFVKPISKIMGNYTNFIKCFSNGPIDQPWFDIIKAIPPCFNEIDYWFRDWVKTLPKKQQVTFEKAEKRFINGGYKEAEQFSQDLLDDPEFPRMISPKELMKMCEYKKFYGYINRKLGSCMELFGQCIPKDRFIMMVGVYEGFGPVVLGWRNNKFVCMMGFENYKCGMWELSKDVTLEEFLKDFKGESPYTIDHVTREFMDAQELKKSVLNEIDQQDWSTTDPILWLNRRGFETYTESTVLKEYGMMCPQQ